jgi:hypothetical protein
VSAPAAEAHFKRPGWFTKHVFNRLVAAFTKVGLSVWGSRVLEVRGRSSGEWRRTPVNLLTYDGDRYLRVSGGGRLRLGRRTETFTAVELADADKVPLLRAYLRRWKAEVGVFFEGVGPDSSEEQLAAIAPNHPVFRITG